MNAQIIPIPIFLHSGSSSEEEKPKVKCPKCGYEFVPPEKEAVEGSAAGAIFFLLMVALLIFFAVDSMALQGRFIHAVFLKSACDLVVTEPYKIVANDHLYAVEVKGMFGAEYLNDCGYGEINAFYLSVSKPSLFYSECKAKGFLKKYLKQQEPKLKNFK